MTRREIYDRAIKKAKITVPTIAVDIRDGLYDMSVAEQIIESRSGVVRRSAQITLDATSTTGQYAVPADMDTFDTLTWSPDAQTRAWYPVFIYTPDAWRNVVASQTQPFAAPGIILVGTPSLVPPSAGGDLFAMVEYNVLNIWPLGIGGTLTMRYKPLLTPYSPSDPNWADYGADPEPRMAVAGLDDQAMSLAIDGISSYMAAQMLMAMPQGLERFADEIALHMGKWQRSIGAVARRSVEITQKSPQRIVPMGGVR